MTFPRRRLLALLTAPLCFFSALVRPAPAQLGPEFQVNSSTTSQQARPAVAADGSGNFVVVWDSIDTGPWQLNVEAQRFDAAGFPVGGEFRVNTYTGYHAWTPSVAVGGTDDFVVVWQTQRGFGPYTDIFGQRFDSAGVRLGGEFLVNSSTLEHQERPAVAAADSGAFVVVWTDWVHDGSTYGIFGQRFDAEGVPEGSEFQVNTFTPGRQDFANLAPDGSGGFVVVWGNRPSPIGFDWHVVGQRFDSAGLPVGGEFEVPTYTTNGQYGPAIAADGAGNFVVVWECGGQDGSGYGIFARRYDSAGVPLGSEFRVNSFTPDDQRAPSVAMDGSGNFIVAWHSPLLEGSNLGVFGRRFDSAGTPVGSDFQVNSYTTGIQRSPRLAADGLGGFVAVWVSEGQDGSDEGVFGRRVAMPYFHDSFERGDACGWTVAVGGGGSCPP